MTWFLGIMCVLIFVGWMWVLLYNAGGLDVETIFGGIFLSAVGTFIGYILLIMILSAVNCAVDDNLTVSEVSTNSTEIIALKDTSNTYSGRGYHDEEFVYVYMIPTANEIGRAHV